MVYNMSQPLLGWLYLTDVKVKVGLDDNGADEVYSSTMEAELSSVLLNMVNSLLGVGGPQRIHSTNVSLWC